MPMTFKNTRLSFANLRHVAAVLLLSPALAFAQTPATPDTTTVVPAGAGVVATVGELATVPPPTLTAKAWLTLDADSGQINASQTPDENVEPAALTRLLAADVVFDALENKRLRLDQRGDVSEQAWRTERSRLFIARTTQVSVDELLQGVIVQSGNDASVALAEAVAG